MRLRAQQSCPALPNTADGALAAARSRSASANTTLADFPPSSKVTRLIVPDARAITSRPASVEPVKVTLATSGCSTRTVPTVVPRPTTTSSTPSGMPASRASSASRSAVSGVSSAGFTTTVLPQARAGPIFHEVMAMGKFHGTMAATTPRGSCQVRSTPPATGMVGPDASPPRPSRSAARRRPWLPRPGCRRWACPRSASRARRSSSAWASTASANRRSSRVRRPGRRHARPERRAEPATAASAASLP